MKYYLKKYRGLYFCVALFSVIEAGLMSYFALRLGGLIDLTNKKGDQIIKGVLICALIIVCDFVASSLLSFFKSRYAFSVIKDVKTKIYCGINRREMDEFKSETNEHYLNVLTKNIDILHDNYLIPRCDIFSYATSAIVSIATIILIDWKLALSFMMVSGLTIVLSQLPGRLMAKKTTEYSEKSKAYLSVINNHLRGFEEIKLLRVFDLFYKDYCAEDYRFEKSRESYYTTKYIAGAFGMFFSFLSMILCMSLGIYFVVKGNITVGLLIAAVQLLNGVFSPIQAFVQNKNLIGTVENIVKEIDSLVTGEQEEKPKFDESIEKITFDQVSLGFDQKDDLIRNADYVFEKGKKYAIMGESGCGKSTLMKLLMKYYGREAYRGDIYINKTNLSQISSDDIYRRIAYIERNEFYIPGSVKENILLRRSEGNLNNSICSRLKLTEEFLEKNLASGAEHKASMGEKQRIDIARFFVEDYDVYIFDEPTSNLDYDTSRMIFDFIFSIQDKTVIVITHDPEEELLSHFDEVVCL